MLRCNKPATQLLLIADLITITILEENSYWIVLLALTIIIFSGTAAPTCRSSSKLEKAAPGTSAIAACKQSHRLLTSRKIMVLLFTYHTGIIMLS